MFKRAQIMEHLTPTMTPARTPAMSPTLPSAMASTMPSTMPTVSSCPSGGSIFMNDKCVCAAGTTKKTMRLPMVPGSLSYCE